MVLGRGRTYLLLTGKSVINHTHRDLCDHTIALDWTTLDQLVSVSLVTKFEAHSFVQPATLPPLFLCLFP
jgi:hypothetical protein